MGIYRERIEQAIIPLLETGFKVIYLLEMPENFGDSRFVLKFQNIKLRITCDRGQYYLEIADSQFEDRWYSLSQIFKMTGLKSIMEPWESVDLAVEEFIKHRDLVVSRLMDSKFKSKLNARS